MRRPSSLLWSAAWALAALAAVVAVATAENVCPNSPEVLTEPFGEVAMELEVGQVIDVGLQCQWRIEGPPGSEVHVAFNWVILDSRCAVTHVVVLDGEGPAAPELTEQTCGMVSKDQVVAVSTGSSATVVLQVNEKSVANEGFAFRYEVQTPTNNTGEQEWQVWERGARSQARSSHAFAIQSMPHVSPTPVPPHTLTLPPPRAPVRSG